MVITYLSHDPLNSIHWSFEYSWSCSKAQMCRI